MSRCFDLDWAPVAGAPQASGVLKTAPEDFRVEEDLGFLPGGEGEHVYLQIEKRGENSTWVARQIAHLAGVKVQDVGYAGLKDRHALTRQWFSVYLPGRGEPDWQQLNTQSTRLLQTARHRQKLRRGSHRGNHFHIVVREFRPVDGADLEARLGRVAAQGVPNYFGPQRFGRDGNNLAEADRLLAAGARMRNCQKRGLILSAARAFLFNRVLDRRVSDGSWNRPMPGEILLDGAPTGPLWGRGRLAGSAETVRLEEQVLQPWRDWCHALEHVGLTQERRSLVCHPQKFTARLEEHCLQLAFDLPPGCFATTVLREICQWRQTPHPAGML